MPDVELRNHVAQYKVEIRAVCDVFDQRPITFPQSLPVVTVQVLDVKMIAEASPRLVEHRRPFGRQNPLRLELRERYRVGFLLTLFDGVPLECRRLLHDNVFAVRGRRISLDILGDGERLAILFRVRHQHRFCRGVAAVNERRCASVQDMLGGDVQTR